MYTVLDEIENILLIPAVHTCGNNLQPPFTSLATNLLSMPPQIIMQGHSLHNEYEAADLKYKNKYYKCITED